MTESVTNLNVNKVQVITKLHEGHGVIELDEILQHTAHMSNTSLKHDKEILNDEKIILKNLRL